MCDFIVGINSGGKCAGKLLGHSDVEIVRWLRLDDAVLLYLGLIGRSNEFVNTVGLN